MLVPYFWVALSISSATSLALLILYLRPQ